MADAGVETFNGLLPGSAEEDTGGARSTTAAGSISSSMLTEILWNTSVPTNRGATKYAATP